MISCSALPLKCQAPRRRQRRPRKRHGLAPLEFVLSLPVLLFMMALMINFGVIAAWKVRTHTAARQVVWRARALHSGNLDPHPADWPRSASISWKQDKGLQTVAKFVSVWPITHPFAHGPLVAGTGHNGQFGQVIMRDRYLLNITDGVGKGTSNIKRSYALMPKMGTFEFTQEHSILDTRGQFPSMGFSDNYSRRARGWYIFEEGAAWAQAETRYRQADQKIVAYAQARQLAVLDREPEFYEQYGSFRDFYAKIGSCRSAMNGSRPFKAECGHCILEPYEVMITLIDNPLGDGLVQRLSGPTGGGKGGIPEQMANDWIALYNAKIVRLRSQKPPNEPEIERLRQEIKKLQEFLGKLS